MERFWSKVKIGPPEECWEWQRGQPGCYGGFDFNGKQVAAHRVSYMLTHNVFLTPEECVLHKCDNRKCVNPNHLYIGDKKQNRKDFMERHPRAKELMEAAFANAARGRTNFWASMSPEEKKEFCQRRRAIQVAKNNGHQPNCKGENCRCVLQS